MKMKKTYIISILTSLALCLHLESCNQSNQNESNMPKPVRQASDGIQLDQGDKIWKANMATTKGVNNMIEIVSNFDKTNDINAFRALHKSLEDEIVTIFTKCNMKGEGHNQLHNFLLPIHELLEPFKVGDLSSCQKALKTLKNKLAIYPLYFE